MKKFFENKVTSLVVILTILFLFFIAISTGEKAKMNWGKDGLNMALEPFQIIFSKSVNSVANFFTHFKDIDDERAKNKELENQVAALEDKLRQSENYKEENNSLRNLVNLNIKSYAKEFQIAEIIARSPNNWNSEFTISKGSADGIEKDNVVITEKGLVGYISEVGTTWSRVRTILNSGTSVGIKIVRSQEFALTTGELPLQKSNQTRLSYITEDTNVLIGDSIETSGLGGIYPAGILVGTVANLQESTLGSSAVVTTSVDFSKLQEVMVIK